MTVRPLPNHSRATAHADVRDAVPAGVFKKLVVFAVLLTGALLV